MSVIFQSLYWTLESQWWVVRTHAPMLETCAQAGSLTARLISIWAPLMCFPQWLGVLFLQTPEAYAVFSARCAAMCIVRRLDDHIPYTRALGLCHLTTLGPLFVWLQTRTTSTTSMNSKFVALQLTVCGLCLFLDARDLILHMLGYPYPTYIRKAVHAGYIPIKDDRAKAKVTWWSILVGP